MSMFGQPKPLASLSSTLLARKGTARPAMRPQGFGGFGGIPGQQDDLGWNDMGHPEEVAPPPAPQLVPDQVFAPPPGVPPVLRQREALQEEFETPAVEPEAEPEPEAPTFVLQTKPVSIATARRIERETVTKQAKAAFTLRLDHDRHLRLRLASALHNRSAQTLVTEALDQFLQSLPQVEELARQLPPQAKR